MTTINLKDFYYWYTQDQLIEVSDEVAEIFKADARYEMAYQRRLSRHKAQYSLDCDDGIEYSACLHEPTPQELLERMETFLRLWNALNSLPEIQGRRIDAHIILGKSIKEIAEAEGVSRSAEGCTLIGQKLNRHGIRVYTPQGKIQLAPPHAFFYSRYHKEGENDLGPGKQKRGSQAKDPRGVP